MKRTTILLPPELRAKAGHHAHRMGISFGELVRLSLEFYLRDSSKGAKNDPLFSDDAVFDGEVPYDSSSSHDRYLYGEDD